MSHRIAEALRILARFWLAEVGVDETRLIAALPQLAPTLPAIDAGAITALAVEYQRLFGFNLPLYESVFVDPSAMLDAPATGRVQDLYRQAGWTPPKGLRFGALDHLGLELLALAAWIESPDGERAQFAHQMQTRHLALWVPACIQALGQLSPHPFYARLGDLTLDLILATLPAEPVGSDGDPFPVLPPPPVYRDSGLPSPPDESDDGGPGWAGVTGLLLVPCRAGMYLTRESVAQITRTLDLPLAVGGRARMLQTLFRLAGRYDLLPALLERLAGAFNEAEAGYRAWAAQYPAWTPYANAWRQRLVSTRTALAKPLLQI
ncbi:MAG: molecular chaperone [Anaerolineae bacterium]